MAHPQPTSPVPILVTVIIVVVAVLICVKMVLSPRLADAPAPPVPQAQLPAPPVPQAESPAKAGEAALPEDENFVAARRRMVERHLRGRDIRDPKVLEVMGRIARQEFVPSARRDSAYADRPLPIGHDQTISQPYIVALMTQLVRPKPESRALDIGTGSGYQAAVLAEMCKEVYSIEILKPLAEDASRRLKTLGYKNVTVRCADGYRGWPEHAPFDVIVVAAAPDHVPQPLVDQLARGGRMVIPVGPRVFSQELLLIEKRKDGGIHRQTVSGVRFVPMTGEAEEKQ